MEVAKLDSLPKTPMWQQYSTIKRQALDALLFYRMGDFYELFLDDAVEAAEILGIALTARHKDLANPVPMCGVPFHSAANYINRLLAQGKRIAICEQVSDPAATKGIVERAIVRVVSPGLVYDNAEIDARANNYLLALDYADLPKQHGGAFATMDVSTGEYRFGEFSSHEELANEIARLNPREVLVSESTSKGAALETFLRMHVDSLRGVAPTSLPDYYFDLDSGHADLCRHFRVLNLEAFGLASGCLALGPIAALLRRVKDGERLGALEHLQAPQAYQQNEFIGIDPATVDHLDLFPKPDRAERESLLWHLDNTCTAMGARRIRSMLERPLRYLAAIQARQNSIRGMVENSDCLSELRRALQGMLDLERLASKIGLKTVTPRDLISIRDGLQRFPSIRAAARPLGVETLAGKLAAELEDFHALVAELSRRLLDEAPPHARDGNIFRTGWHANLDELIGLSTNGVQVIAEMETKERALTGIANLKIKFNRVFGYYFEVSKSQLKLVPDRFIRKQTTVNGERFITEELKTFEEKVLSAEERRIRLEASLFQETCALVSAELGRILSAARKVAELDAYASLAQAAVRGGWIAPHLEESAELEILEGRHPIVESLVGRDHFVANNIDLGDRARVLLITGPNMAGKSTFMRQIAVLTLMAQIGSYIPAKSAKIGLVDRIASRVGASDRIGQGQSTFMVEMNEIARILRQASERSLLIIDEIGRGTSTFDGLALAWAILEDIVLRLRSRTLFATHYHELTSLETQLRGLENWNVEVREANGEVLFLHRVGRGAASGSYGIQVAKLAGVPKAVLERAQAVLQKLEQGSAKEFKRRRALVVDSQMALFTASEVAPAETVPAKLETPEHLQAILRDLESFDLNSSTPIDALLRLKSLKDRLPPSIS